MFAWPASASAERARTSASPSCKLKDWSRAQRRRPAPQRRRRPRHGRFLADPGRAWPSPSPRRRCASWATPPASTSHLQDIDGVGHDALVAARNQVLGMAAQSKVLANVRPQRPGRHAAVRDRRRPAKGQRAGPDRRPTSTHAVEHAWASAYVNDFIDRGRVKRCTCRPSADSAWCRTTSNQWFVRNTTGEMVPFSAFSTCAVDVRLAAAGALQRLLGDRDPGRGGAGRELGRRRWTRSSGSRRKLPPGIGYEWTGLSYQERAAGAQTWRSMRCRSWSCSCAWPRCTRAGRSRSR